MKKLFFKILSLNAFWLKKRFSSERLQKVKLRLWQWWSLVALVFLLTLGSSVWFNADGAQPTPTSRVQVSRISTQPLEPLPLLPDIQLPDIQLPDIQLPDIQLPDIQLPDNRLLANKTTHEAPDETVETTAEAGLVLGKQYYDAGQFVRAVEAWQQSLEALGDTATLPQQAIVQNYLAIGYQALGNWPAAVTATETGLALLSEAPNDPATAFLTAQILSTQGVGLLQTGQAEAALATWQQAENIYKRQSATSALVRNQISQAQALRILGHYRQARQQLETINQTLAALPTSWHKVQALQSLGVTLRAMGQLNDSQQQLLNALSLAKQLPADASLTKTRQAALQLSLAKTLAAQGDVNGALDLAQQLQAQAHTASFNQPQIESGVLLLSLWQAQEQWDAVRQQFRALQRQLQAQPVSRWSVYAQVNAAETMMALTTSHPTQWNQEWSAIAQLLSNAVHKAETLADPRAESYALGQLGHAYEQTQQWPEALRLTQQALTLANQIQALDIATRWQWQQGRILAVQEQLDPAISAYTAAVEGLDKLQQDLIAVDPNIQFSFREQVEPVYRQLVQLLLKEVDGLPVAEQQPRLEKARTTIESLKLAEIQNYFREACLTAKPRPIEDIDSKAAVIYPILLADRLEVIAFIPGQPLRHSGIAFPKSSQTEFFQSFFLGLNPVKPSLALLPQSQQLYDWLIRPFTPDLASQSIETLVFVLDGFLQALPMSMLHDGQHYLLENYQIALSQGLQLLSSQPLVPEALNVLAMGLSEPVGGFSALPGVAAELADINSLTAAKTLLNADFTKANFFSQIQSTPSNIVHLATHGQFSSSADETFLLAWDGRINVRELDQVFRQSDEMRSPIELLVLSACQTASGDDRAALGMAAITVRSGARSAVATLWSVSDNATSALMNAFYTNLNQPNISRAQALRQAQLSLLQNPKYKHPFYWSPFVLVGSWQ